MAKAPAKPKATPEANLPSPEDYQGFLQGLELRHVRLISLKVESFEEEPRPLESAVSIEGDTEFVQLETGFEAQTRYCVSFTERASGEKLGSIEAIYGFRYESKTRPNDEGAAAYFEIFKDVNIPVNSWPFMRELTYNMMARMSWTPFALPLLKPLPSTPTKKTPAKRRKASG
jgi:hypothetical protein